MTNKYLIAQRNDVTQMPQWRTFERRGRTIDAGFAPNRNFSAATVIDACGNLHLRLEQSKNVRQVERRRRDARVDKADSGPIGLAGGGPGSTVADNARQTLSERSV